MDGTKNFAFGTLASGINSSATSLTVGSGEGARFPSVPFNAALYNRSDYLSPGHAFQAGEAEIVRVTGIAGDTLTITRAQESTTARNFNTGGKVYEIWAGPTAGFFAQITNSIPGAVVNTVTGNVSLPLANSRPSGWPITIKSEAGVTTTVNAAGSDLIEHGDTSDTIAENCALTYVTDGASNWSRS